MHHDNSLKLAPLPSAMLLTCPRSEHQASADLMISSQQEMEQYVGRWSVLKPLVVRGTWGYVDHAAHKASITTHRFLLTADCSVLAQVKLLHRWSSQLRQPARSRCQAIQR
jgi:hypothetical protein